MVCAGESLVRCEMRASVGHGDKPSQFFRHAQQRLGIVARTEDAKAGARGTEVGPDRHFRAGDGDPIVDRLGGRERSLRNVLKLNLETIKCCWQISPSRPHFEPGKSSAANMLAFQNCRDRQRNPATEGFLDGSKKRPRGCAAFEKQMDDASAARTIREVAILFNGGIALNNWTVRSKPPGAARHLSFKTSAAHSACAAAVERQQHARSRFAIA